MKKETMWEMAYVIDSYCQRYGNKTTDWYGLAQSKRLKYDEAKRLCELLEKERRTATDNSILIDMLRNHLGQGFKWEKKPGRIIREKMEEIPLFKETQQSKAVSDKVQALIEAVELEEANKRKIPLMKVKGAGYIKPPLFDEVYALVKNGVQVFLNGPAGCGKSRLFEEIANTMEIPFFTMSMSGGMRYAQVFGATQLKGSKSEWLPSELLIAIQKKGLVFIDEILSADPEVSLGLNALLEKNTRCIQTPIGKIKVHKDCKLVAAANTEGRSANRQYTGAQRVDDSLLDRFVQVPFTYCPKTEKKILEALKLTKDVVSYFVEEIKAIRLNVKKNNIPYDPSTRRLISAAEVYACGVKKERAFELAFLTPLSPAERKKVESEGLKA